MKTNPLFGVITAMGRPEYGLLNRMANSLIGLNGVTKGECSGVEWVVALDSVMLASSDSILEAKKEINLIANQKNLNVKIVINNSPSTGPGPARNVALSYITAPYLLTVDSDDLICADGFILMLEVIASNNIGWVAGRCPHIDLEDNLIWAGPPDYFHEGIIETSNSFWEAKKKLGGIPFLCTGTLVKTDAIKTVGGWPNGIRRRAEDTALWAVLGSQYRGYWLPIDVYKYRRHQDSITHQPGFHSFDENLKEIALMVEARTTQISDISY